MKIGIKIKVNKQNRLNSFLEQKVHYTSNPTRYTKLMLLLFQFELQWEEEDMNSSVLC